MLRGQLYESNNFDDVGVKDEENKWKTIDHDKGLKIIFEEKERRDGKKWR